MYMGLIVKGEHSHSPVLKAGQNAHQYVKMCADIKMKGLCRKDKVNDDNILPFLLAKYTKTGGKLS